MAVKFKNVKVKGKIVNPYTPEELAARAANPQITPQTTQQATGQTRPDVFNPKENRFESAFTPTEQLANKEMLAEQQKGEVEKFKMENQPVIPGAAELATQQAIEQEQLGNMLTGQPQPTVAQRNVQAGMATVNSILETLGGNAVSLETQQEMIDKAGVAGAPAKVLLSTLGKVTTVDIPFTGGFSLSDLFSKSNVGNIAELNSDAQAITGRARLIYADASSRGGDQKKAIEQLKLSEEAVRQRYSDAAIALSASPSDIAEGVDFTEEIYSNMVVLQSYRQALERQQITGEKNAALLATATNQPAA